MNDDYTQLLQSLKGLNIDPSNIIDFSNLDNSKLGTTDIKGIDTPSKSFGNLSTANGIGSIVSGLTDAIAPKQRSFNSKFVSSNPDVAASLRKEMNIEGIRGTLGKAASVIPGVGGIISGAEAIGRAVDNATKDEFGVYKSKGAQIADTILDPLGTITDLFQGGPGKIQSERRKARDHFFATQENEKIGQNRQVGTLIKNNLPTYKAPAYGKQGMSFKTKFASK